MISFYVDKKLTVDLNGHIITVKNAFKLKIRKETIDILLINYIDLFLMNYNKFLLKIRNCDLKELSFDINNDAGVVEEIFLND